MENGDDNDIWMDMKDVTIGEKIGQGMFSTVYAGKYFGDIIAVKKQVRDAKALETYLVREITVLKKCEHENLVSYIGASNELSEEDGGQHALYIFTELCPGGDLLELLINQKQDLGWRFRIKIALEAATALAYMHANNFIHRDMKSSNLLLDADWRCKITDFGLAREVEDHSPRRMTICGTNEYMAPELLWDEEYSYGIDVFSFGMVLLEILKRAKVGHDGFAERHPQTKFEMDADEVCSLLPENAPQSLVMLAQQCISADVSGRLECSEIVDWLQDLFANTEEDTVPLPTMRPLSDYDVRTPSPSAIVRQRGQSSSSKQQQYNNKISTADSSYSESSSTIQAASMETASTLCTEVTTSTFAQHNHQPSSPKGLSSSPTVKLSFPLSPASTTGLSEDTEGQSCATPIQIQFSPSESRQSQSLRDAFGSSSKGEDDVTSQRTRTAAAAAAMSGERGKQQADSKRQNGSIHNKPQSIWPWATTASPDGVGFGASRTQLRFQSPEKERDDQEEEEEVMKNPVKSGYLHKRNTTGFRNWKKVWFAVTKTRLWWRDEKKDKEKMHFFLLKGATVMKTNHFRFQLLNIVDEDERLYKRELAADSIQGLNAWVTVISEAIERANAVEETRKSGTLTRDTTVESSSSSSVAGGGIDVSDWLAALGLAAVVGPSSGSPAYGYDDLFKSQGLDTLDAVRRAGLTDENLTLLGITNPTHRTLLIAASLTDFAEGLTISVSDWRDFGSAVAFTVVTRWRFFRSSTMLPFNDFKVFDVNLRKELKSDLKADYQSASLESRLPTFPPGNMFVLHSQKDPAFINSRQQALEAYLQGVATTLEGTKHLRLLLNFLEVVPVDFK